MTTPWNPPIPDRFAHVKLPPDTPLTVPLVPAPSNEIPLRVEAVRNQLVLPIAGDTLAGKLAFGSIR